MLPLRTLCELLHLLPRVGDINARNRHGMTALMKAAFFGHEPVVRVLLERGADPNVVRNDSFTALALAAFAPERNVSLYVLTALLGVLITLDLFLPQKILGYRIAMIAAVIGGARILYGALEGLFEGKVGAGQARHLVTHFLKRFSHAVACSGDVAHLFTMHGHIQANGLEARRWLQQKRRDVVVVNLHALIAPAGIIDSGAGVDYRCAGLLRSGYIERELGFRAHLGQ